MTVSLENGELREIELGKYRHFKGKTCQVFAIAKHSENNNYLVIYRKLDENGEIYARPLLMFASEVDHKKYPDVTQKYRFERID